MKLTPLLTVTGATLLFISCEKKEEAPKDSAQKPEQQTEQVNPTAKKAKLPAKGYGSAHVNAARKIGTLQEKSAKDAQQTLKSVTPSR